jgi:2-oxoglutarate dehydrogenase E2 component (dihydrolipoamide succinyltransferase)
MSEFKVYMPKMGESVQEATITKWFVKEGDTIAEDGLLFEIATEKVDSEIPSPVEGVVSRIFFQVDDVVPVGELVALIVPKEQMPSMEGESLAKIKETPNEQQVKDATDFPKEENTTRFLSPLVRTIAKEEGITHEELNKMIGSGIGGRIQKKDLLDYLNTKAAKTEADIHVVPVHELKRETSKTTHEPKLPATPKVSISIGANDQIIEMDRVRRLIAEHMVNSVQMAPHVTSVVEADVTNLVLWRNRVKEEFKQKYAENLTYMPVFVEVVAQALREFPYVNSSVNENKIILRSRVNIGIAVAKPDGNLIVPVITDADRKNLIGLSASLNDLANRARNNKLSPDEIQGGTFSITNFGSFRNIIGTPIINQPQVAILATGSIEKKPAVMETPTGDAIVVRHKMFLSLSYDHRVIDGALGGAFLRRIADLLELFDVNRKI